MQLWLNLTFQQVYVGQSSPVHKADCLKSSKSKSKGPVLHKHNNPLS